MSGVQNVLSAHGASTFSVTIGSSSPLFGYSDNLGFGSISPPAFRGSDIIQVWCAASGGQSRDLIVTLDGIHTQNAFTAVVVQKTNGQTQTFLTASADDFDTGSSTSFWRWGTGSNPPWSNDSTSPRWVMFY